MDSQGSADEDDNGQYDDTYVREDFPSVEDWLYCKKMVDLVWVNEMEDADGPETEEPEARVLRRSRQNKCIPVASYKCDAENKYFLWGKGTLKVKAGGKVNIRRVGDDCPWKHDLCVTLISGNRLDIHYASRLPEEVETGFWQIELSTDTVQRDRIVDAIYWFSKRSTMLKKVMHDQLLTSAERTDANCLTPMVSSNVAVSLWFRANTQCLRPDSFIKTNLCNKTYTSFVSPKTVRRDQEEA